VVELSGPPFLFFFWVLISAGPVDPRTVMTGTWCGKDKLRGEFVMVGECGYDRGTRLAQRTPAAGKLSLGGGFRLNKVELGTDHPPYKPYEKSFRPVCRRSPW